MAARLEEMPNVRFLPGVGTAGVTTRDREARLRLSDGRSASVRLLVAADGRNSPVREALEIPVSATRFGQKALVFAVTHAEPHDNISTEVHRSGGPFTLVPLPDHDGKPCSAVVWMDHGAEVLRRLDMDTTAFEAEATTRSANLFGPLTLASPRSAWPIIAQIARRITGQRTALIAEAAHVVPPIGAQGLNMSLADLATLLDLAEADPENLGTQKMLDAYARARLPDIRARVAGVTALNRMSIAGDPILTALRAEGIRAWMDPASVRHTLMRTGLGARG